MYINFKFIYKFCVKVYKSEITKHFGGENSAVMPDR